MLASMLALGGCDPVRLAISQVPSSYQPLRYSLTGGYVDSQLDQDSYRVRFHASRVTEQTVLEDYLLYRAAELAIDNGYKFFVVECFDLRISTSRYSYPGRSAYGKIKLLKEAQPGLAARDAWKIIRDIGPKYSIPPPKKIDRKQKN